MGGYGLQNHGNVGPSTSGDFMSVGQAQGHSLTSSEMAPSMQTSSVTEPEKSLMIELAMNAMDELVRVAQTNEPLWVKNVNDNSREILSLETYAKIFPRAAEPKGFNVREEATRDSGLVIINGNTLVDIFMDVVKH